MPNDLGNAMRHIVVSGAIVPDSVNQDSRTIDVVMTTKTQDRDGDVVDPTGGSLEQFQKNPVVLWQHDRSIPAFANVTEIWLDGENLMARVKFAEGDEWAEKLFNLYSQGILKAWSIGFRPTDYEMITEPFAEGEGDRVTGLNIKTWELFELSGVNLGANPLALTKSDDTRILKGVMFRYDGEKVIDTELKISKSAFLKSLGEKGEASKIPVRSGEIETPYEYVFDIIRVDDGIIKEARVCEIILKSPDETRRQESKVEKAKTDSTKTSEPPVKKSSRREDPSRRIARLRFLEVKMKELE